MPFTLPMLISLKTSGMPMPRRRLPLSQIESSGEYSPISSGFSWPVWAVFPNTTAARDFMKTKTQGSQVHDNLPNQNLLSEFKTKEFSREKTFGHWKCWSS